MSQVTVQLCVSWVGSVRVSLPNMQSPEVSWTSMIGTSTHRVRPLVPADQLIRERQARHKAPLLQPEDGCEAA